MQTLEQVIPEPEPLNMNELQLDDPRLTYEFIYEKYAAQEPDSYHEFLEKWRKEEIVLHAFEKVASHLRELEDRRNILIEKFPERTIESSPQMKKIMAESEKWEQKMRDMDTSFDDLDAELDKFETLEKTYPPASEEDYRILYTCW